MQQLRTTASSDGEADGEGESFDAYDAFGTPPTRHSYLRQGSRLRQPALRRGDSSRLSAAGTPRGGTLERAVSKNQRQRARQQERQFKVSQYWHVETLSAACTLPCFWALTFVLRRLRCPEE